MFFFPSSRLSVENPLRTALLIIQLQIIDVKVREIPISVKICKITKQKDFFRKRKIFQFRKSLNEKPTSLSKTARIVSDCKYFFVTAEENK